MDLFKYLLIVGGITLGASCKDKDLDSSEVHLEFDEEAASQFVDVISLRKQDFSKEINTNGQIRATLKSTLKSGIRGQIRELRVKNGDDVNKGQVIAQLNDVEYKLKVEKAKIDLKLAELELQDMLMSYNGLKGRDDSLYLRIKDNCLLKSGYALAKQAVKNAEYDLEMTSLKSPINGTVANLKIRNNEYIDADVELCLIIDQSQFEVEFLILESELGDVKLGQLVIISSFQNKIFSEGQITEINPMVDEEGFVFTKAKLKDSKNLFDGMNVRVSLKSVFSGQLVVPKSAVLKRQDKEVLFKYVRGKAEWVYVNTLMENSDFVSIGADIEKDAVLQPDDTVIISNNLNLVHGSPVNIPNNK